MNVLEKILEEIEAEKKRQSEVCKDIVDTLGYRLYEMTVGIIEKIIRSYMGEVISEIEKVENDGWIPDSERLPKVQEGLEDVHCPEFNVTIKGAKEATTLKCSWDGSWFDDNGNVYSVIAWRPLPEAYRPEEVNNEQRL